MAKVVNNILMRGVSGMIGGQIVFRTIKGRTYACKPPVKRKKTVLSESEELNRRKFSRARTYAKWAMSDETVKSLYRKSVRKNRTAYRLAFRDGFNAPRIVRIDTENYNGHPGNVISVRAMDDFRVTGLRVIIYSAEGKLVEEGDAKLSCNGIDWLYTTTVTNLPASGSTVYATAKDLPGNTDSLQVTIP